MKSFAQILQESKTTYSFNIGVAGELPEGIADRLESVLKKFNVLSFSTGKKTRIQKVDTRTHSETQTYRTYTHTHTHTHHTHTHTHTHKNCQYL